MKKNKIKSIDVIIAEHAGIFKKETMTTDVLRFINEIRKHDEQKKRLESKNE